MKESLQEAMMSNIDSRICERLKELNIYEYGYGEGYRTFQHLGKTYRIKIDIIGKNGEPEKIR